MILRHKTAISVAVGLLVLVLWVLTVGDTSWPRWVWYGLAIPLALQAAIRRGLRARRIDRDLHHGAEARFVSVAMNLGLAEELLDKDPQSVAELLARSRSSKLSALGDLRTVMQPPVLADRGLEGAVCALALDLAVPVTVVGGIPGQPPPPAESAACLAVSECLANVVKHSGAGRAEVDLGYRDGVLPVVVSDDGDGGASMTAGTGLFGVARRLEAFDGTIALASPAGGPTVVRMEPGHSVAGCGL